MPHVDEVVFIENAAGCGVALAVFVADEAICGHAARHGHSLSRHRWLCAAGRTNAHERSSRTIQVCRHRPSRGDQPPVAQLGPRPSAFGPDEAEKRTVGIRRGERQRRARDTGPARPVSRRRRAAPGRCAGSRRALRLMVTHNVPTTRTTRPITRVKIAVIGDVNTETAATAR